MSQQIEHVRRGGTSLVVTVSGDRLPRILHWGRDLGDLDESELETLERCSLPAVGDTVIYAPQPIPVLPQLAEAWLGRPGLVGSRDGSSWAPMFRVIGLSRVDSPETSRLVVDAADDPSALHLSIEFELHESGLLRVRSTLQNDGVSYRIDAWDHALPVPSHAVELMDLAGRWTRERAPQRRPFDIGLWTRESRGGKPGFEAPTLMIAGEAGFGFQSGEVWAVHVAWSGNQHLSAERTPAGTRVLRGGELFHPDELVLGQGERVSSPWLYASWGEGLDAMSARFHQYLRSRPSHPRTPRPVLLNTWEAVYFDHDENQLLAMAERAAALGIERFVLDDGWFRGRRHDRVGLGDWDVDPTVWPRGLRPLADRVHELGMEFGLWFEPEMINLDSELARRHPEWIFDAGHGVGVPSRHQHVLDLAHPAAFHHVAAKLSERIAELGIDFIKWDHNRSLLDAGHSPTGRAGVRAHTLAVYRLLDLLRARFPGLEIESCASGGGRIDLGILERVDRVWASDCSDPHERADINRWTSLLVPPELIGTHIGQPTAYATGRTASLTHRAAVASLWQLGIEADLGDDVEDELRRWIDFHKRWRGLIATGSMVRADPTESARIDGIVGADDALYLYQVRFRPAGWPTGRLRFPGLDDLRRYRVRLAGVTAGISPATAPPWTAGDVVLPGRVLRAIGIEAPGVDVDVPLIFEVTAER
ncbi:UNVERIFIED_CONTAM: alpha-galactosidase [Microbacterium sp. SLM126]